MMKTLWIDPNDIADMWTVNNRKENPGHIESLAASMRQNGYLPEYPIIAFRTEGIPTLPTDKELRCILQFTNFSVHRGIAT